jgi:3-dehydroshikimate dehydratase
MIRLSAFADEIAVDLEEQVEVLLSENIHYIEFRSAWGINVLDLTDQQLVQAGRIFEMNGLSVATIGSPVGKVPIDAPFGEHFQRFERALTVARVLGTSSIRIFSFYPPSNPGERSNPVEWRDEVFRRLREFTMLAREAGVVLLHENEKDIYGDIIARNVDLLRSIDDQYFRSVLDPANYLQCQQIPYPDAYEATRPWLASVHVKDVRADGTLSVAGEGEAHWPELLQRLRQDGYQGFLALEPHLAAAAKYQGFSGPDLFRQAAQALKRLLAAMNWDYA